MVTPSPQWVETIVSAAHELTEGRGSGLFLFVDLETLRASNPLEVEWVRGKGSNLKLED
jgi:hypothetical protein